MDNEVSRAARSFLDGEDGKKLAAKRDDIQRIAASRDGENVKNMLQQSGFEEAVRRGDTKALRDAVAGVMKTDSGARLMRSLQDLMGR